jgi:hypothetical protein
MWWDSPFLWGFKARFAPPLIGLIARAFAVVQVGGVQGTGPERGRNFEQAFYGLCDRWGVLLSERAGSRSVGAQRSGSGFSHEVDAASRGAQFATHWELKYLSGSPSKNDFLIFNGKGLDFLHGHDASAVRIPLHRFFLTGTNVTDECRYFAALWGISIIEPDRLPLPLLYTAAATGGAALLNRSSRLAVENLVPWGFRPLQDAIAQLADWCGGSYDEVKRSLALNISARELVDAQEQIGADIFDHLDNQFPGWIDDLAETTWVELGGW